MYYFAIEIQAKMPYPLAPPQGWEACRSLTIQQPAIGNWQLAGKPNPFGRHRAKPTPIWDDLGCGGIPREGGGMQSTAITEVARDRRHRKMGWLGMSRCNSFGILVDGQGEGGRAERA
jgi:hypothetical protein